MAKRERDRSRWPSQSNEYQRAYHLKYHRSKMEKLAGRPRPDRCEVCGGLSRRTKSGAHTLHFDHDHRTGKFRGWLCSRCNVILGQAEDNEVLLRDLADYLDFNHEERE